MLDRLKNLPGDVFHRLLGFLEPQSLIYLAQTNYAYYHPCIKTLYQTITIIPNSKLSTKATRIKNFQDCHGAVLSGLQDCYDVYKNLLMVRAKLQALNVALSINPELIQFVEEVRIFESFDKQPDILAELVALMDRISVNPRTKVFIDNDNLRKVLKKRCKTQINSIIIDYEDEYETVSRIDEVDVRVGRFTEVPSFKKVRSIVIRDPKLLLYLKTHGIVLSPESVNVDKHTDTSVVNLGCVKNLEVVIQDDQDDVLMELAPLLNIRHIRKLVIVENNLYQHEKNELIDIKVLKFLNLFQRQFDNLSYLMIKYNPPHDGIINDGFEGNYLRKLSIITLLTSVLNNFPITKINLILPNFLMVLSCYEQAMNNMMWNGCKCPYCDQYLNRLDEFINYHKYFDPRDNYWKDLTNTIVLNTLSHYYQQRYLVKNNWDYMNSGTLQIKYWNFHNNYCSPIQFQCSVLQNVFQSDYNEKDEEEEVFFDSYQRFHQCEYLWLFPRIAKCLTHYLQDINHQLINLNRGDAESFQLSLNNLNDGSESVNVLNLSINGFQFYFDKELNGTNFVESYFD